MKNFAIFVVCMIRESYNKWPLRFDYRANCIFTVIFCVGRHFTWNLCSSCSIPFLFFPRLLVSAIRFSFYLLFFYSLLSSILPSTLLFSSILSSSLPFSSPLLFALSPLYLSTSLCFSPFIFFSHLIFPSFLLHYQRRAIMEAKHT